MEVHKLEEQSINKLNELWIEAGQTVSDLDRELTEQVANPEIDEKQYAALKEKRDNAIFRRNAIKNQLDELGANRRSKEDNSQGFSTRNTNPVDKSKQDYRKQFVQAFKGMLKGDPNYINLITSSDDPSTGTGAGLTIPKDVETQIHEYLRTSNSLQNYVDIEVVGTTHGDRVYEPLEAMTPLEDIDDENGDIPDADEPKLTKISFDIHRYSGINTITNSLLKDSDENILAWLTNWLKKKVVVTRNQKIINVLNSLPNKPNVTKFDDIIDMYTKGIDPALDSGAMFITNQNGWNAISKIKNQFGGYLINPDVQESGTKFINGRPIAVISPRDLPDVNNAHPLYYGNFKEAVKLYDRENMSLLTSNIADTAFKRDQTKIRVIDRFDVKAIDKEAVIAASFKNIADLNPATPPAHP